MQRGPCNIVGMKTNILNEIHFRHQFVEIVGDLRLCIDSDLRISIVEARFELNRVFMKITTKGGSFKSLCQFCQEIVLQICMHLD